MFYANVGILEACRLSNMIQIYVFVMFQHMQPPAQQNVDLGGLKARLVLRCSSTCRPCGAKDSPREHQNLQLLKQFRQCVAFDQRQTYTCEAPIAILQHMQPEFIKRHPLDALKQACFGMFQQI